MTNKIREFQSRSQSLSYFHLSTNDLNDVWTGIHSACPSEKTWQTTYGSLCLVSFKFRINDGLFEKNKSLINVCGFSPSTDPLNWRQKKIRKTAK
jgi:hypothetical protein